jgi:hypothetical protein
MWHVGAALGALIGAGLEYNHYCTNPLYTDHANCATLMSDPEHVGWGATGLVLGGLAGLAYQVYEGKKKD